MPLKGVSQVRGRYQAVIKDIAENKTRKVVTAIVATGAAWAKKFTPVDVPFLINTQQKRVRPENGVMVGRVWYEAEYAIYLETNPSWKPRKKKPPSRTSCALGSRMKARNQRLKRLSEMGTSYD